VWFVLLAGFTWALFANEPKWVQPCLKSMTAHSDGSRQNGGEHTLSGDPHENLLNPCDSWSQDLPLAVKLYAVGWWVSLLGLLYTLTVSLFRRIVAIRGNKRIG
jgi:hypothetical protein